LIGRPLRPITCGGDRRRVSCCGRSQQQAVAAISQSNPAAWLERLCEEHLI
jgi:hypothetical protein